MKTICQTIIFLALAAAISSNAAVPQTTVYRGRLLDSTGNTVDNSSVQINFILYDAASGGTALYEDRNAGVSVEGGMYSCVIGDDTTDYSRTTTDYGTALGMATHMEISIGGSTMSPREELRSQPYAINAEFAPLTVDIDTGSITWQIPASPMVGIENTIPIDLTNATQVRIKINSQVINAGGASAPKFLGVWSPDQVSWYYFDGSSGPTLDVSTDGLHVSSWTDITDAAKGEVYITIAVMDGSTTCQVKYTMFQADFR